MQGKKNKIILNLFTKNLTRELVYSSLRLRRIGLKFLKIK